MIKHLQHLLAPLDVYSLCIESIRGRFHKSEWYVGQLQTASEGELGVINKRRKRQKEELTVFSLEASTSVDCLPKMNITLQR